MLDFLNKPHIIDEIDYENIMLTQVEPYLEKRRKEAVFLSHDMQKLHYEAYEKLLSRGSIIILHGFTESAEKFRESSYYFRKAGYSVYALDLRGHGKSYHSSDKAERVDIDSFDSYARDLDTFIETVVKPATANGKIYIYSHSLGSTVALLYHLKHPGTVKKTVLSSPMICGNMGMPAAVAGTVAKALCAVGGKKTPAPGRCVFNPAQTAQESDATSHARFLYYHNKRINETAYQTSGPSFSWVKASLEARDKIMSGASSGAFDGDFIIFRPEEDKQLDMTYTDKFARQADIKIKDVKNSRHEIFMSKNNTLSWYFEEILEFFGE